MTGTPMKDQPQEIASMMNLILPLNRQLPTDNEFVEEFLVKTGENQYSVREDRVSILKSYFHGKISYLKARRSDVKKIFTGVPEFGELQKFVVEPLKMSIFQSRHYLESYNLDIGKDAKGIYSNSRQSSLFVFPDGSSGKIGYTNNIVESKNELTGNTSFRLSDLTTRSILGKTQQETIENIRKCSAKYAAVIETLLNNNTRSAFVYCDFVQGSGCILLSKLLELVGFSRSVGNETTKGLRYSIVTNKTTSRSQIRSILTRFNSSDNMNGEYIRVIIGSRVIGEGFSLKNIGDIHILTPHWNYSETDQAIARGIRAFSHTDLERAGKNPYVRIFQYVALPLDREYSRSIDYRMYKISEDKDLSIKRIERLIRESAMDCALTYKRNYTPGSDDQRVCEYMSCHYNCDGIDAADIKGVGDTDPVTYYQYYANNEVSEIVEKTRKLFSVATKYTWRQIASALSPHTPFSILLSYDWCMNENVVFVNRYNQLCYLKSYRDIFYLDTDPDRDVHYGEWDYLESPCFYEVRDIYDLVSVYQQTSIPKMIKKMVKAPPERYDSLFHRLPKQVQHLFIETAVISKIKGVVQDTEFRDWLLDRYKQLVFEVDGMWVSTLQRVRCLRDGVWEDCDIDVEALKSREVAENPYGYLGVYVEDEPVKNKKFKIQDLSVDRNPGKVCVFYNSEVLLEIAEKIGMNRDILEGRPKPEICSEIYKYLLSKKLVRYTTVEREKKAKKK
jgi:hypothetical protein